MSDQVVPKAETTLTDEQLCEAVEDWVSKLAKSGGRAWLLRVPVDYNRDPDILMTALARRHRALCTRVQAAEKVVEALWEFCVRVPHEGRAQEAKRLYAAYRDDYPEGDDDG